MTAVEIQRKKSLFRSLLRGKSAKIGWSVLFVLVLLILFGIFFDKYGPSQSTPALNAPPSSEHLFGTDYLGHDLFSQLVWGAYPTLSVTFYVAFASTIIGFIEGIIAGYYNKLEAPLSGLGDIFMALPSIPILILLGTIFLGSTAIIGILLIIVLWAPVARSVRYQVASVKKQSYIETEKVSGVRDIEIVLKMIAVEVGPLAIANFIINLTVALILLTALQFLGVGNPLAINWGTMLYWAQQYAFLNGDWWWVAAPGLFISAVAGSLALIGYSLEEAFNPRLRGFSRV